MSSKSTPTDLVSEADLAAERAIRELLAGRRPDDGFVGEEGEASAGSSGLRWVVDPLDGTVNFLFGIPQWCVSVAVRDEHGTLAGAVYDPNRDELFTATREGRARLSSPERDSSRAGGPPSRPRQLGGGRRLAGAMVATGLRLRRGGARRSGAGARARSLPRVRDIRRFGSAALDLGWTAAGRYDAYFERTVKPWDIAAGALICERAGLVRARAARARAPALGHPRGPPALAESLLELAPGEPRASGAERARVQAPLRDAPGRRAWRARCGGWDSNPHALSDRAF